MDSPASADRSAAAPPLRLAPAGGPAAGFPAPPPDAAFAASAPDGPPLHVRSYGPETPGSRTLLWVHGAFEHGGRYAHAARFFADRGWRVLVPDLRGHGESGGVPMHVRRFDEYAADLRAVLDAAGADPARTAAVGNSMGGLAVARLLAGAGAGASGGDAAAGTEAERPPVAAAALCSPLLRIVTPVPLLTRAAGRAVTLVRPTTRFAVPPDPLAPPEPEYAADPLRHDSVTAAWFFAVRRGVRRAWAEAGRVAAPLAVVQSGADRVVCPDAGRAWLGTVASADRSFRALPGAAHEVFREPDWAAHAADLDRWLAARVPPAAARRAA